MTTRARPRNATPPKRNGASPEQRIGELEAELGRQADATRTQAALYRIAELASRAPEMDDFYRGIHEIVGELLYAENFYIAVYDPSRREISFPFFVDAEDSDPEIWRPVALDTGGGATAHILMTGRLFHHGGEAARQDLAKAGIHIQGSTSSDYLGVPLLDEGRALGVLAVQSYRDDIVYDVADEQLLTFVAQHVAAAHERTRNAAEVRQRNAELAVINEIGAALADQLDFAAVIELVGEKIRSIFEVQSGTIGLYDQQAHLLRFPYSIEDGVRVHWPDRDIDVGLSAIVIRTKGPLRINTGAEMLALGGVVREDDGIREMRPEDVEAEDQSLLSVPILAGDRVLGVIKLDRAGTYAFSESDERLLSTIASSMGVALENARLFDETKRLLGETEQRNAELAVINEIGAALAKQLDFEGVIELVGEKIRSIFEAPTAIISLYDPATNVLTTPYSIDQGERTEWPPRPFGPDLASEVIRTRQPLRLDTNAEAKAHGAIISGTNDAESWLGVPILAGDRVLGAIALERLPANAFSDSDERLLSTLASSMGGALENARLFDETKRLLDETEQRNAELAVVNEIGNALGKQLEFDSIIEVVGKRLNEIFKSGDIYIALYDKSTNLISFPYELDAGRRVHSDPIQLGEGLTTKVIRSRRPLRFGTLEDQKSEGSTPATYAEYEAGTPGQSWLGVPILAGEEALGVVVFGEQRAHAFTDADERLVSTIVSSMGVALENARLFAETKRLLGETEQRNAELAVVNELGDALAKQL